ncbi:acyl-[acyl-carrier-protein] thioesterase [Sedimentibacter sp. MB31-C6]|uniref:acyl-[acyl-carrier-protein] thioesterase n=1 Tax=Sedimentibacter sp. MB31-C6 TaxID=3109366 RepID=UPI002DDD28CE|nr:acyl-ACP thioesterase domain-containing protein [Sedimentibacter sp. MB36-C1]WSI05289.1 acyl-ACP thioesterase domain-containing protein [Sedimentibacter sp. MB36-C1]
MESICRKNYKVEVNDVDFNQKLKLSSLFMYLQDMATIHAERLGFGRNNLQNYGVIWVLIRAKVDIIRYPKWNEEIAIETWPQQPNKIEFERDFIVYDSKGDIIARAVSSWVIIDIVNRKLKRSKLINPAFPLIDRERALVCQLGKLKANGILEPIYKKTVGYSDVDMNEHLNNAKYIDYIMDCFSLENHKKYFVQSIEIDYIHEALPGDSILLSKDLTQVDNNIIYIEGLNEKDKKVAFKSKVIIKHT